MYVSGKRSPEKVVGSLSVQGGSMAVFGVTGGGTAGYDLRDIESLLVTAKGEKFGVHIVYDDSRVGGTQLVMGLPVLTKLLDKLRTARRFAST